MSQELILSIPQAMTSIEAFESAITELWKDSPEKAYLIGNQMAKVSKKIQDAHKEGFQGYYDQNKELPGGFECRVSEKKTYDYSSNEEYARKKAELDTLEETLKHATEQSMKGLITMDAQGTIIEPVPVKMTEVYTVTKKK